jgi:integrase
MEIVKSITPAAIDRIKAGSTLRDIMPGLYVERNANGTASWRYMRKAKGGPVIKRTLGSTMTFSIPDAREWAQGLNALIERGQNPAELEAQDEAAVAAEAERAAVEAARQANTFRVVWERYIDMIEPQQAPKTIQMKRCRMNKDILPAIGEKAITDVTLDDLWDIAQAKLDDGFEVASNHLVTDIKSFFAWCQSHGRHIAKLNGQNPAEHLKKLGEMAERTRFIDIWELPLLLRAMAEMPSVERRVLTLLLLTGQRLDNVLSAEFDQWEPLVPAWIIFRMKGRKRERVPNVLPLGPWGASLFVPPAPIEGESERATARAAKYLFPSSRGDGFRIGHMRALCDDLVTRMQAHAPKGRTVERLIPHDFRRTLKSNLARLKVPKEHRHAIAGHRDGGIDKHYMMYEFMDEKAAGLARWEAELIRIAKAEGVADKLGIPEAEPVAMAA